MVGSSSEVSLKVTEQDIESLTASIVSPSGREEPCFLKRLNNGHLGETFTLYFSVHNQILFVLTLPSADKGMAKKIYPGYIKVTLNQSSALFPILKDNLLEKEKREEKRNQSQNLDHSKFKSRLKAFERSYVT